MRFKTSGRQWGQQGSEHTQSFVSYQRLEACFKTVRNFPYLSFPFRFVSLLFVILACVSFPSLGQEGFDRTFSGVGPETFAAIKTPTQGEYAVRWSARLGFGDDLTEEDAIARLTKVGIEPQGGWQVNDKVTTSFLTELT